jgi:hypothetical protein
MRSLTRRFRDWFRSRRRRRSLEAVSSERLEPKGLPDGWVMRGGVPHRNLTGDEWLTDSRPRAAQRQRWLDRDRRRAERGYHA